MKSNSEYIKQFNIAELFEKGGDGFLIPIYQRNYEWGSGQIIQLLEDIKDYYKYNESSNDDYFIGTLVVNKREESGRVVYEAIDGQQRLTTLNIVLAVLNKFLTDEEKDLLSPNIELSISNIDFESRPNARRTIETIFRNGIEYPKFSDFNENIYEAIKIVWDQFKLYKEELGEKEFHQFLKYLLEKVILLRVEVPEKTDLNHYFEIMNSRGEQLEKHEILKAQLMAVFKDEEDALVLRKTYHMVWDVCSIMNRYIQMGFPKDFRSRLFGNRWFEFSSRTPDEFFRIFDVLFRDGEGDIRAIGMKQIITANQTEYEHLKKDLIEEKTELESDSEYRQFQEIINFQNFLLHVLRITVVQLDLDVNVSLDDKKLLDFFREALRASNDGVDFAKTFLFNLCKSRFLLDQYVLKRKYVSEKDEWSLNVLKYYPKDENRIQDSYSYINSFEKEDENKELIMLLSMFHVSTPTLSYKNWLYETLKYLNDNYDYGMNSNPDEYPEYPSNIEPLGYIEALRGIATKYLRYRILNGEKELSYEEMLIEDEIERAPFSFDQEKLTFGNIRNNLVFNFIDYWYWKIYSPTYKDFEFSFRSSVEHYYPRHPLSGKILDSEHLNCIGNLCLISHNQNSKLSNYSPKAKREHYANSQSKDSIKQMIMMKAGDDWEEPEIESHNQEVIDLLRKTVFELNYQVEEIITEFKNRKQ